MKKEGKRSTSKARYGTRSPCVGYFARLHDRIVCLEYSPGFAAYKILVAEQHYGQTCSENNAFNFREKYTHIKKGIYVCLRLEFISNITIRTHVIFVFTRYSRQYRHAYIMYTFVLTHAYTIIKILYKLN